MSSSVVAAASSAAVVSSAAATANAATPVSSAAASSSSAIVAAVASSSSSVATTSSAVASSSASASASSSAAASSAASSSASSPAAASSSSSSSSSAASSSASSSSISSVVSKSSSASSSNASATAIVGSASTTSSSSGGGLSSGAIGGIAGGVVGAIVLIGVAYAIWRSCRGRGEKVAPPPPREMAYNSASYNRGGRPPSVSMLSNAPQRASSYSTLLYSNQPSSYQSHSRQPSYYNTYPVATPSSLGQDGSSPPIGMASTPSNGSPPLSAAGTNGANTPAMRPTLVPIDTALDESMAPPPHISGLQPAPAPFDESMGSSVEGGSSMQSQSRSASQPRLNHVSSSDRLRAAEYGTSSGSSHSDRERAPSPSSAHLGSGSGGSNSRAPSESGSTSLSSSPRPSGSTRPASQYPRPHSMASISSSSRYLHIGPPGGAPHQGRNIQIQLPKPLGKGEEWEAFTPSPMMSTSPTWAGHGFGNDDPYSRASMTLSHGGSSSSGGGYDRRHSQSMSMGHIRRHSRYDNGYPSPSSDFGPGVPLPPVPPMPQAPPQLPPLAHTRVPSTLSYSNHPIDDDDAAEGVLGVQPNPAARVPSQSQSPRSPQSPHSPRGSNRSYPVNPGSQSPTVPFPLAQPVRADAPADPETVLNRTE